MNSKGRRRKKKKRRKREHMIGKWKEKRAGEGFLLLKPYIAQKDSVTMKGAHASGQLELNLIFATLHSNGANQLTLFF